MNDFFKRRKLKGKYLSSGTTGLLSIGNIDVLGYKKDGTIANFFQGISTYLWVEWLDSHRFSVGVQLVYIFRMDLNSVSFSILHTDEHGGFHLFQGLRKHEKRSWPFLLFSQSLKQVETFMQFCMQSNRKGDRKQVRSEEQNQFNS